MSKHVHLITLTLFAIALSSCGGGGADPMQGWTKVTRDVYSSYFYEQKGTSTEAKVGRIEGYITPSNPYAVYVNLEQFASMYEPELKEGFTSSVKDDVWSVKKGDQLVYVAGIDASSRCFYVSGSLSSALLSSPTEYGTLLMGLQYYSNYVKTGTNVAKIPYYNAATNIAPVQVKSTLYAPISVFDVAFCESSSRSHFDNQDAIMQYSTYSDLEFPIGKSDAPFKDNIASILDSGGNLPEAFVKLERDTFYYMMDTRYGLSRHKRISSMSDYFRITGVDDLLLERNPKKSLDNYVYAVASLNDGHTGFNALATCLGDDKSQVHHGDLLTERIALAKTLYADRQKAYAARGLTPRQSVAYSESGKTAYFSFDQFAIDKKPYEEGSTRRRDDLWKSDEFFWFIHAFDEIKAKGGVANVVIDESCNGGGLVVVALKLLALISKKNASHLYQEDMRYEHISKTDVAVDSNFDGSFNADDVYGDDFDIYILTSPMSFSCGNLFPIYAKWGYDVKSIGYSSGGGECVVGSCVLPSGRGLQISSKTRIVLPQGEDEFVGVESGSVTDIPLAYSAYFDFEAVENAIESAKDN